MSFISHSTFELGQVVATQNAFDTIPTIDVMSALSRHGQGDWGELGEEDRLVNEQSLLDGGRLMSVYTASNHVRFWIITEADRSSTCILLPEDY